MSALFFLMHYCFIFFIHFKLVGSYPYVDVIHAMILFNKMLVG